MSPYNLLQTPVEAKPTNQQHATYQRLDKSKPISTWRYLKHYIHLVTNPKRLYNELLPPYPTHGVLLFPDVFIDFKGKVHLLDPRCHDLILFAHQVYSKEVMIHYGTDSNISLDQKVVHEPPGLSKRNMSAFPQGKLTILMNSDLAIRMSNKEVNIDNRP